VCVCVSVHGNSLCVCWHIVFGARVLTKFNDKRFRILRGPAYSPTGGNRIPKYTNGINSELGTRSAV